MEKSDSIVMLNWPFLTKKDIITCKDKNDIFVEKKYPNQSVRLKMRKEVKRTIKQVYSYIKY